MREEIWLQGKLITWQEAQLNPANPIIYHFLSFFFCRPTVAIVTPLVSTATHGSKGKRLHRGRCMGKICQKTMKVSCKVKAYAVSPPPIFFSPQFWKNKSFMLFVFNTTSIVVIQEEREEGMKNSCDIKEARLLLLWLATWWQYVPFQTVTLSTFDLSTGSKQYRNIIFFLHS